MPFAESPHGPIHYRDVGAPGASHAVVLIQGLGLSSRFWFDVPDKLGEDPDRPRRVLAIDNRGTGESARPRAPFSLGDMADDVARLLDHVGVESATVVGISMGGMIAQHVALRHPARVSGLVLMATTPGFVFGELPRARALGRLLTMPLRRRDRAGAMGRLLLPRSQWSRSREILRDHQRAMAIDPPSGRTFALHVLAAARHLTAPRLGEVRCPTRVIAGAEDELIPPGNARAIARRIPGAQLDVLADVGHAIFVGDRDLVVRAVRSVEDARVELAGPSRRRAGAAAPR
ncbi:MAG: alpha/beta fold hydrolase [Myxococcales bacterium]|nr:alpha/beta fold hydrolase [Myxococcales bacterium]